jgi:hypothetical protein
MNKQDEKFLEISLLIEESIKNKDSNEIELIGVFFHELMVYVTNYILIDSSVYKYEQELRFPFLNSDYIDNMHLINFKPVIKKKKLFYKFIEYIQKILPLNKTIYLSYSTSRSIKRFVMSNIFKYRFKQVNIGLSLENWDEEILKLQDLLLNISTLMTIKSPEVFIQNFLQYVHSFSVKENICLNVNDSLLIDSNMDIYNRISSAWFLMNVNKVISVGHGEHSIQVLDEPMVSYAELSYITDYITYGKNLIPLSSSISLSPDIHYRYSELIYSYFDNSPIKFLKLNSEIKILYVPTSFAGNLRYGPYRDIEDQLYLKWQKALMDIDLDITYKQHINVNMDTDFDIHKVETRPLAQVMHLYDVYVLDYVSTASAMLFATNKPIVFFDIGLRNLHVEAKKDLEARVFKKEINFKYDLKSQINDGLDEYNKGMIFTNTYTQNYSLNDKSLSQVIDTILDD